jgi:hypothetical protein
LHATKIGGCVEDTIIIPGLISKQLETA